MNLFADIWHGTVNEVLSFAHDEILSDEEIQRRDEFIYEKDRLSFSAAHILKRHALSQSADIGPASWRFQYDTFGRPEIDSDFFDKPLFFNISHKCDAVCCLVSNIPDCGIDLEVIHDKINFKELAETVFSPFEIEYCLTVPEERTKRFFELWCLKEAYMKALGFGFNMNPLSFSFQIKNNQIILLNQPEWRFKLFNINNKYMIASGLKKGCNVNYTLRKLHQMVLP